MNRRTNDSGIFDQVYREVYPLLFRIAYRITDDFPVAEDLCQEAFLRYYRRITPLPTLDQAKFWLIRVVKNLSFNYEKRKGREKRAYNRFGMEPKAGVRSGETELMRRESAELVQKALKRLPYKLRIVIVLREFEELSYREIADVVGISESNVKVRVFRAREQLRKYLDEEETSVS